MNSRRIGITSGSATCLKNFNSICLALTPVNIITIKGIVAKSGIIHRSRSIQRSQRGSESFVQNQAWQRARQEIGKNNSNNILVYPFKFIFSLFRTTVLRKLKLWLLRLKKNTPTITWAWRLIHSTRRWNWHLVSRYDIGSIVLVPCIANTAV